MLRCRDGCCDVCCSAYSLIGTVHIFFFFKQKTAYEMRISDWSSDVCSADLRAFLHVVAQCLAIERRLQLVGHQDHDDIGPFRRLSSEERRVGKEGVSTCRSRGSADL